MTATPETPPPEKTVRGVITLRVFPAGRKAILAAARRDGFTQYTAWLRAVAAAEATNPKHHVRPKPGE